jgi:hypothetical protein
MGCDPASLTKRPRTFRTNVLPLSSSFQWSFEPHRCGQFTVPLTYVGLSDSCACGHCVLPDCLPHDHSGHCVLSDNLPHDDSGHCVLSDSLPHDDSGHYVLSVCLPHDDTGHCVLSVSLPHDDSGHCVLFDSLPHDDSRHCVLSVCLPHDDSGNCVQSDAVLMKSMTYCDFKIFTRVLLHFSVFSYFIICFCRNWI